jgi:hypothetical protein
MSHSNSLTANWTSTYQRPRKLLSALLRSDRALGSPLLIVSHDGNDARTIVLDILSENSAYYGYVSGLHTGGGAAVSGNTGIAAGQDRQLLHRVTLQLFQPQLRQQVFRQWCVAPPREEEEIIAAAAEKEKEIAMNIKRRKIKGGGINIGDETAEEHIATTDPFSDEAGLIDVADASFVPVDASKPRGRGRRKRKAESMLALAAVSDLIVPLHPAALVDDLSAGASATAASAGYDTVAGASTTADAVSSSGELLAPGAVSGSAVAAANSSMHRVQLLELVNRLGELLHTFNMAQRSKEQNTQLHVHSSTALRAPPTFFLVLDHPERLLEAHPTLLLSLLRLSSHTGYPVSIVLLSTSTAGFTPDGASGVLGLNDRYEWEQFIRIEIPAQNIEEQEAGTNSMAERLWKENRFIQSAFHSNHHSSSTAIPIAPSLLSRHYLAWSHFVRSLLSHFHANLTCSSPRENEHILRTILPFWWHAMQRRIQSAEAVTAIATNAIGATDTSGVGWLLENKSSASSRTSSSAAHSSSTMSAYASQLTALLLKELQPQIRALLNGTFRHEETALPVQSSGIIASASSSSSSTAVANVSRSPSKPSVSSSPVVGQLGLPPPPVPGSHGSALSVQLSRTQKLLLVASFIGSYNAPSADTSLFIAGSRRASNKRGKSAAVDRSRMSKNADVNSSLTPTQIGPNACTLERLMAIFTVIAEDEYSDNNDDLSSSSSIHVSSNQFRMPSREDLYKSLQSLLGAHLLEQVGTGRGGGILTSSKKSSNATDPLLGVKIRCLLSMIDMEAICATIDVKQKRKNENLAMGARMGERFDLRAWLSDKRK